MPGLPALARAFDAALDAVDEEAKRAIVPIIGGASHLAVMRLGEATSDVLTAGRTLARTHRAAVRVYVEARDDSPNVASTAGWEIRTQRPQLDELRVAVKAWLYFVRAFCDHAYRLILAGLEGKPARQGGSMKTAAGNPSNPVAVALAEREPTLMHWFERHRDLRNLMKEGTQFGFTGVDSNGLTLSIYTTRAHTSPRRAVEVLPEQSLSFADCKVDADNLCVLLRAMGALHGARTPGSPAP